MSADALAESYCVPACGLAEALYFDSAGHQLFGWLHRAPAENLTNTGLVICNPFGYEAICSHRCVRAFAEAAAALGVPSLRFDYVGTGDSADIDPRTNQLALWTQDVVSAIGELRRCTGVQTVCLLGFRLGALLATLAAVQCGAVDSLILAAPVVSGRRYLRELRTTRLAASLKLNPTDSSLSTQGAVPTDEVGSLEVSGFSLSAATVKALAGIDLINLTRPPASDMLIVDGKGLPTARRWAEGLPSIGARTEYQTLPGLIEMFMTDPQFAIIPQALLTAMRGWLLRYENGRSGQTKEGEESSPGASARLAPALTLPGDEPRSQAALVERPVFLSSVAVIFGIVTEPHPDEKRRRAVLLLNVGAEHHVGSCRMYVSLARQWARHGYIVLRLDLAGLGDSATRPGRPDDEVFPPAALDDIRIAIEFLRRRYGAVDITLGGLCSGGYHSMRAAVAALPVNRLLIINPMTFFWSEGMTAFQMQQAVDVARNFGFYRERLLSAMIWRRILTGELSIWRILRILIQRPLLVLESTLRDLARSLGIRLPRDLGWELQEIAARGVRVEFVFSRGEPGLDLLKLQGGSSVERLGEQCHVHIIDSADHIFSQSGPRAMLEKVITEALYARNPGRTESKHPAFARGDSSSSS
jgi:alpha-beta hydrolase superfamily lysophospholipase